MADFKDPFSNVLQEMNDCLSSVGELNEPLQLASSVVTGLDDCLHGASDFTNVLSLVEDAVDGAEGIIPVLSPIPVVGEVADAFDGVLASINSVITATTDTFEEINGAIITPVMDVLDDVKKGMVDLQKVVTMVSTTVPQYVNTVSILSYLMDIAYPLTQLLVGTEPGERLNKVVTELNTVKDKVGTAVKPLADGLKKITDGIKYFADEVKKMLEKLFDAIDSFLRDKLGYKGPKLSVDTAINGIEHAAQIAGSIMSGLEKAVTSLAPVRWALDAIKWITDHILKPVINWIMKHTGLQKLVDSAEEAVCKKLGVEDIFGFIKGEVDNDGIQSKKQEAGSEQSGATVKAFSDFAEALGNYRNNKSEALKDATFGLVSAITGTPIDPDQGGVMPDWPDVPDLNSNSSDGSVALMQPGYSLRDRELDRAFDAIDAMHSSRLAAGSGKPALGITSLLVSADGPVPLPAVDPKAWPNCSALIDKAKEVAGTLTVLSTDSTTLYTSMKGFDGSLVLPDAFGSQVADMHEALITCDDFLKFVLAFKVDFINTLVAGVEPIITKQMDDCTQVTGEVQPLQAAFTEVEVAASGVRDAMPKTGLVSKTIGRLDGWAIAVQQLVAIMERAADKSGDEEGKYDDRIDQLKSQIEASAQDLMDRLENIDSAIQSAHASTKQLVHALDDYSGALSPLSTHSQAMSVKAMPALHRTAHVLGIIDSIFDPLSCLLQVEGCVDGDTMVKKGASFAAEAIQGVGEAASKVEAFEKIAEDFAEQVLPMGQIASAMSNASGVLSEVVADTFKTQAAKLGGAYGKLSDLLKQTKQYESKDKDGKPLTIANDLVDGKFVEDIQTLLKQMEGNDAQA